MTDAVQYLTLGLGDDALAVPVAGVQEILELRPMARLPHAPPALLGMIDVRGRSVPVIDLRTKLSLGGDKADDVDTRIVVLNVAAQAGQLTLGLKADRVFEVAAMDSSELEPPPEIGMRWRSECIAGVGRRNGRFVTVLDLDRLFTDGELDLLGQDAGEAAHAA